MVDEVKVAVVERTEEKVEVPNVVVVVAPAVVVPPGAAVVVVAPPPLPPLPPPTVVVVVGVAVRGNVVLENKATANWLTGMSANGIKAIIAWKRMK